MLSYSVCQGEEVEVEVEGGVEGRSSGRIDVVVPDEIACHITVRATRYLYRERIPTSLIRKRKKKDCNKDRNDGIY